MFSLEISFKDGVSQKETVLIRRPQALIGAQDIAHVVLMDMKSLDYQIRLVRDLGRRFQVFVVPNREGSEFHNGIEGTYEGEVSFDIGPLALKIHSLDADLALRPDETPDKAGVRVLRQACAAKSPLFPAVVVLGSHPMVVSFEQGQPLLVGRSKQCVVRLDIAEISSTHARIGYEDGEFWVEDLGSTNGTFLQKQQISGKVQVPVGAPIILGRDVTLIGVTSEDQIHRVLRSDSLPVEHPVVAVSRYPALVSASVVARPARLSLPSGATLKIGRDQSCDMWLGAPHVSRMHCTVTEEGQGEVSVRDYSTNGTGYDDMILRRGDVLRLHQRPRVFDFGGGVTVAVCFSAAEEETFLRTQGSIEAFRKAPPAMPPSSVERLMGGSPVLQQARVDENLPPPSSMINSISRYGVDKAGMILVSMSLFVILSLLFIVWKNI